MYKSKKNSKLYTLNSQLFCTFAAVRRKTLIFVLLFVVVFVMAELPVLRFRNMPKRKAMVTVKDTVAPQDTSTNDVPADSATKPSLAVDTTRMDSLQLLVYKRNKAIDDSLHMDSLNRKRKNGIDAPVEYSAEDSMTYEAATGYAHLYGNAKVNYEDMNLESDQIYMNLDSSLVYANGTTDSLGVVKGAPVFKMGRDTYENDSMAFNFKTKKGLISGVYTAQEDGFLTSELSKRGADGELFLQHGRYTTCDQDHPDFYLALSRAKVRPGKNVVFGPAYLVVADVPLPFAIPYGFFPFTKSYSSGFIMPTYGDEMTRGFYLRDGGYYFAISDKMDLKLLGEIYTKGSWGLSAASNYRKRYKYSGSFFMSYQSTVTGDKNMPDYQKNTSFKLTWTHTQDPKANPFSTLTASVNFATSNYESNNLTSLYNPQSLAQTTRTSSVSWSTKFSSLGMSLSSSFSVNQNMRDSTISLKLPNIVVNVARFYPFRGKGAATHWYDQIYMTYKGELSNSISTKENKLLHSSLSKDWENGIRHDIPIGGNFTLFDVLNVNPSFNFTDRMYFRRNQKSWDEVNQKEVTDTVTGFYNVYNWSLNLGMSTKIYGTYVPNRKLFGDKIVAIRHVLTPNVSFSYAPNFGTSRYGYYQTYQKTDRDGNVTLVEYSPYQGALFSPPLSKSRQMSMDFSFSNNVEMKIRSESDSTGFKKISLIDDLQLGMSYNFAAENQPLSPLRTSLRVKLSKSYTLNLSTQFASYVYELDDNGNPVESQHTTYWQQGKWGRFQGLSQNLSYSLDNTKVVKFFKWLRGERDDDEDKDKGRGNEEDEEDDEIDPLNPNMDRDAERAKHSARKNDKEKADVDENGYMAFNMPWSLHIGYSINLQENRSGSFNYETMRYPYRVTQSLNLSGNIRLADGWDINFSSGYDFDNKKISVTTASLSRDLHCFNMSCQVTLAPYTSYNFSFRCNAATLTDVLKYDKRSGYSNAVQWY